MMQTRANRNFLLPKSERPRESTKALKIIVFLALVLAVVALVFSAMVYLKIVELKTLHRQSEASSAQQHKLFKGRMGALHARNIELKRDVETYEKKFGKEETAIKNKISSLSRDVCVVLGGFVFKKTCFKLHYNVGEGVDLAEATRLCRSKNRKLAEISSNEMYDAVRGYVKYNWVSYTNLRSAKYTEVWLGSTYRNGSIVLSSGEQVTVDRWHPRYPVNSTSLFAMAMHVETKVEVDEENENGLLNTYPANRWPVPLCSFEL